MGKILRPKIDDQHVQRVVSQIRNFATTRCFANSSNRLDEYINCLVVTQRWLVDEITRSLTFYRRALLYCAFPIQTQHGS